MSLKPPQTRTLHDALLARQPLHLGMNSAGAIAQGEAHTAEAALRPLREEEFTSDARWLWTMRDTTELTRLRAETARAVERLERAQEFGRLGMFERELPMGKGHWDAHMFRMWSLDPALGAPDFNTFVARIHRDDRPGMDYREAAKTPGKYAKRYRIHRPRRRAVAARACAVGGESRRRRRAEP